MLQSVFTFAYSVADCKLSPKEDKKKRNFYADAMQRINLEGVKMDDLGGKEQDVPFLRQPVMQNQCVCSARVAKLHWQQANIHSSTQH